MTITTKKTSTITVEGTHTNKNCKPVFCITTGAIYASVSDAASINGVTLVSMSGHLNGRYNSCKGKKFCLVSNMAEYADEIAQSMCTKNAKAIAYDNIITEQNRIKEANEKLRRHRETCEKLRQQMEAEMKALEDAEAEVKSLGLN
jgi:hypothetical protein